MNIGATITMVKVNNGKKSKSCEVAESNRDG